ncbi:MAG: hypothetical protein HYS69_12520, partial [candidate division NC10 bacterium]|nr:hypothetical protein [candidate division NC10 bacterium]
PEGGAAGYLPDLETMLSEYYDYRGWDVGGIPRPETLERLGLGREAADLATKTMPGRAGRAHANGGGGEKEA